VSIPEIFMAVMLVAASVPFGFIAGMVFIGLPLSHLGLGDKASMFLGVVLGIGLSWWMIFDIVRGWQAPSTGSGSGSVEALDEDRWLRP
jgi:hypothetical protein